MWWFSALGTLLVATVLNGLPLNSEPDAEILPAALENATLATELMPPPIDGINGTKHGVVYLINLFAVVNASDLEDGEEKLSDEIIESMPGILAPVATVLLVVEADDEDEPVSLDEIATELESEGFAIEKVSKNGETKVIKVDFGDDTDGEKNNRVAAEEMINLESTTNKVRRKRAPCLKCKLGKLMGGYGGGGGGYGGGGYGGGGYPSGGGGGCGGGCGGGGGQRVIPVVVVPVNGYPGGGGGGNRPHGGGGGGGGGGHYPSGGGGGGYYPGGGGGGGYYPGGGGGGGYPSGGGGQCNVCGGQGHQGGHPGGGGGGGGGGGSWSQASAQASAQSSSGSW